MRIAHFSDLHLLHLDGARVLDFANKRWIGGANLLLNRGRHYHPEIFEALVGDLGRNDLDHVVCTGDIGNLALEQEFVFARACFDRIPLRPDGVTVIPGNHDTYVKEGAGYFSSCFADYYEPDSEWAWEHGEPWPVVRVRGDVAIIGLSSSRTTPWFTAYGRIGKSQLSRLQSVLGSDRLAGKFRLVALHHRPVGWGSRSRIRGLRDASQLRAVLREAGAELVIHGHEHKDLSATLPGPSRAILVRGIQSGTYEAGRAHLRARYRIYEITQRIGTNRPMVRGESTRVWNPRSRAFVANAAR